MDVSHRLTIGICPTPGCGQKIRVCNGRFPGGINDRGGFVIECTACHEKSHIRVSNPTDASYVESGGKVVGTWDDEIEGDMDKMLAKHGVSETERLSDTLLYIPSTEPDDPLFVLGERPIYACAQCGADLERLAYAELEKALAPINRSMSEHLTIYLKGYTQKAQTCISAVDISTSVRIFAASSATQLVSSLALTGIPAASKSDSSVYRRSSGDSVMTRS